MAIGGTFLFALKPIYIKPAFVCTVLPSFMITEAISRIGVSRTSILGAVGPVFTIILAVFVINEPFSFQHAIGLVLVLIGVGCISLKKETL